MTRQSSHTIPRLRRYLTTNYFHQKDTKPVVKSSTFHFYYSENFTWKKKQTCWHSLVIMTWKSWSLMLLWKVQNSQQNLSKHSRKINRKVIKLKRSPCALLVCQLIMLFFKKSPLKFLHFPLKSCFSSKYSFFGKSYD